MATDKFKPKATRPPLTSKPRGFDFNRKPVPDNPEWEVDAAEEEGPPLSYPERQRMMPPSRRDNPTLNFCKGGKVISSRKY